MPRNARSKRKARKAQGALKDGGMADGESKGEDAKVAILKDKADKSFLAHNYDEAVEFYTQAIAEDGKNANLYSNRSATHSAMKKYESALQDALMAVELKPTWTKAYYRKADALMSLLRYQEAHATYQEGLKIDPDDALLRPAMTRLEELLAELKITEAQLSSEANPDQDKFGTMVKWMRDGGCKFPMLYLQYYSEDYRGVHALTKIPNSTVILYVPFKHVMTSDVAKASDIGKKILSSGVDLRSKHSYLAAYLLQEKHTPDSFWQPYLRILPERYRNMPIFFTPDELEWLQGSFTLEKIQDRIDSLRREYESICRSVPEFRRFTHFEFVWARLVVITRIFGLVIKGKKTDGLVPYADMLNHKPPREVHGPGVKAVPESQTCNTKWTFDDDVYGFTITTTRSIPRGEEVYDSYGRKCNSRFFVNYGFSLDDNDDNEVVVKVALPKQDPHYLMKVRFLGGRADSGQREFQIPATYKEKKTKELLSFLRFAHARDAEMAMLPETGKVDEIDPISIRNEIEALKHLKRSARYVLEGFPQSIEEDNKWLAENPGYSNIRNCVLMRHGEKTVLHWLINLADKAIPLLRMPWKDLKRIAAKCYQEQSTFDHYVTQVVVPLVKGQK